MNSNGVQTDSPTEVAKSYTCRRESGYMSHAGGWLSVDPLCTANPWLRGRQFLTGVAVQERLLQDHSASVQARPEPDIIVFY